MIIFFYLEQIKGILLLFPALCIVDNWNEKFPTFDSIPDTQDLWGVTLGRVFFETIHGYDVFENIGKFNKDILIFHGDQDEIVPLEYGNRASKLYPHAKIEDLKVKDMDFQKLVIRKWLR